MKMALWKPTPQFTLPKKKKKEPVRVGPTREAARKLGGKTKITPEMGLPMGTKTSRAETFVGGKTKSSILQQKQAAAAKELKGLKNVWNVMKISLNPFSKERVEVNPEAINNMIIRNGLEAAANNPYTTALVATGIVGLGKATGKFIVGKSVGEVSSLGGLKVARGTMSLYETNTKTLALTSNLLVKAGFTIGAILIIKDAIGSYPFAKFEVSEALQALGIARWKAFEAGDKESMDSLNQLQQEILNPTGWDKLFSSLPWSNVFVAAKDNIEAAKASTEVFNKIIEDGITSQENGETEDEKWERIKQEEADQDKAAVDYYNSERKKLLEWEHQAEAAARAAQQAEYEKGREKQREAEVKARNADAAFWAKEEAKQRELEAADRRAIADFWMAYRIQMQKINDDNRPSNLNFGLL